MKLEDVPDGERLFIDANILIYHFSGVSVECRAFLERCESRQVAAFTGVHVLLEVTHRLMILEALNKGLISGGQPARKLKERPHIIKGLSDYNRSVQQVPRMGVRIRALAPAIIRESEAVRTQHGLMTNDSITVALMRKLGLTAIATHDSDLLHVPGLTSYQPQDIP
jgi:predicted nucleic acid-binding protein